MRFFLLIVVILALIGAYFFIPFDEGIEKLRMRSQKIVDKASEPLPKLEDIKEIPSTLENMFNGEELNSAEESRVSEGSTEEGEAPEGESVPPLTDTEAGAETEPGADGNVAQREEEAGGLETAEGVDETESAEETESTAESEESEDFETAEEGGETVTTEDQAAESPQQETTTGTNSATIVRRNS